MATQMTNEKANRSEDRAHESMNATVINDTNPLAVAIIQRNHQHDTKTNTPAGNNGVPQTKRDSTISSPINCPLALSNINDFTHQEVNTLALRSDGTTPLDLKSNDDYENKGAQKSQSITKSNRITVNQTGTRVLVSMDEMLVDDKGKVYDTNGHHISTIDNPGDSLNIKGREYRIIRDSKTNSQVRVSKSGFANKLTVYRLDKASIKYQSSSNQSSLYKDGVYDRSIDAGAVLVDIDPAQSFVGDKQLAICYRDSKANGIATNSSATCRLIVPYSSKPKFTMRKKWNQLCTRICEVTDGRFDGVMKAIQFKDEDSVDMLNSVKMESLCTLTPSKEMLAKKIAADRLIKEQKPTKQMDIREQIKYRKHTLMLICFLIFLALILIIIIK